ncbi:hypothetical protein [Nocardia sp. NPDC050406]|uniref:hypothetical protein n=1 Tax=Nocardia sp. NPDC050406 TaxID=3364318 RepID=UPI003797BC44
MRRAVAVAVVAGCLVAGVAGATGAQPIADAGSAAMRESEPKESLGPFEQESQCLARGNRGIERGEWADYECVGGPGSWWVQPR